MRLWSISPIYLDVKGLTACWREALLGQNVLMGKTKGYKNHPQLERFKKCEYPLRAIGQYLTEIYIEAKKRGYKFDVNKIGYFYCFSVDNLTVTRGQLIYEFNHLQDKLFTRDKKKMEENFALVKQNVSNLILTNSIFQPINGQVESWEKIK